MLSSTSVQKFRNDKKPKKKYQKFKSNEEKDNAVANPLLQNETEKKNVVFVDLKDFPDLTSSARQNRNLFNERNNSRYKTNKPYLSVVCSGDEKQLKEAFPALESNKNFKLKDSSSSKKNTEAISAPGNDISMSANRADAEKQTITNCEQDKPVMKKIPIRQQQRNPNKKKRSDPVFINFEDILATNKIQKKAERKHRRSLRSIVHRLKDKELLSGNVLDSSNPKRNRGKHREIKKKKLSKLKMTIIKERIIKNKLREEAIAAQFGCSSINLLDKINFKTEIKMYLDELHNKKMKDLEIKKAKLCETLGIRLGKINTEGHESESTKLVKKEENAENTPHVKEKIIPHITAEGKIKFSSKFREYCDNMITPDLNSAVTKLIEELIKLQDRLFFRDPIKAKARKRHVSGIREVRKYLSLKKVKMIIIAPNLEKLQMEGSVYDTVDELKSMAVSQNVPYGFALDRYKLGRCTKKNVPISAFAVLSYEGIEALYESALAELVEAKRKFSELAKPKGNPEDVNMKMLSTLVSAFQEFVQVSSQCKTPSDVN